MLRADAGTIRTRASRRAPRWLGALGLCLLLAHGVLTTWVRPAAAEDTVEQMRERLLRARTQGEREGALKLILARPADQVGAALGPLFSQPELGASPELLVATAKLLAESPVGANGGKGGTVLLADYIFRSLANDDTFVTRLRDALAVDPLTEQAPDWNRLVDNALGFLDARGGRTLADRVAAIRFLGREEGPRAAGVVDELERHVRRLRQDANLPSEEREAEGAALLAALSRLLVYGFASLDAALPELEATRGWPYVRRLRHFSGLKTAADRDRALAVLHGTSVIRAMATPAELTQVLTGDQFPYPEHHRAALARAAQLKPEPGAAWEEFYRSVLARTAESGVVELALSQLSEAGFGGGPRECCHALAEAVQKRLESANPRDPAPVRRRLMVTLGDMAAYEPVLRQASLVLARRTIAPEEIPEVVELVRAMGRVSGADAKSLKPFYDLTDSLVVSDAAGREALRSAVARALGREGIRASDPVAAAAALRGMLEGSAGWDRAVLPSVRQQAYRSLAAYPTDEVATWLERMASGAEANRETDALLAVEALGQMLGMSDPGPRQGALRLAEFLEGSLTSVFGDARRVEALRRLKGLPAGESVPAEVRARALAAIRGCLHRSASDVVRTEAARAAAELADVEALGLVTEWWRETPTPASADLLRALLEGVVRAGPAGDRAIAEALETVATTVGQEDLAVQWADLAVRSLPPKEPVRPLLLRAQAKALMARAAVRPEDAAGRERSAEDLGAARVVLTALVAAAATPAEADGPRRVLLDALERLADVLGEGPIAADRLVEAVAQAVRGRDRAVLQAGERIGLRVLETAGLRQHLSPERLADLQKQLDAIRDALGRE